MSGVKNNKLLTVMLAGVKVWFSILGRGRRRHLSERSIAGTGTRVQTIEGGGARLCVGYGGIAFFVVIPSTCKTRRPRPLLVRRDCSVLEGILNLNRDGFKQRGKLTLSSIMVSSSEKSVEPSSCDRFQSKLTLSNKAFCL